jgi:hypothetical protein
LPGGIFSNQKSLLWYILEGLGMENYGTYYGHLEYFMSICIFCDHFEYFVVFLVYISQFWYVAPRNIRQPCLSPSSKAYLLSSLSFLVVSLFSPTLHNRVPHWSEKSVAPSRVPRWVIFKPKKPIWVNLGGSCNGRR